MARMLWVAALAGVAAVAGCGGETEEIGPPIPEGPEQPIRIVSVELGRSVDGEMGVPPSARTNEFAPLDTIHASVATEGTLGNAIVTARWTGPGGTVLAEASRAISPTRPTVLAFQYAAGAALPTGVYGLTVMLDGVGAETVEFTIR